MKTLVPGLFALWLLCLHPAHGQHKYWIYFKDKGPRCNYSGLVSDRTLAGRSLLGLQREQHSDLPVHQAYTRSIQAEGIQIINCSKWLNAVTAYLDVRQVQLLRALPFVQWVSPARGDVYVTGAGSYSGGPDLYATQQVGGEVLQKAGLTGKGVPVGIIDGGFYGADKNPLLSHIFNSGRVLGQKDFRAPAPDFYAADPSDAHGTSVWHTIAGFDQPGKVQYGMARDASFYLATTEVQDKEFRGEEDYWIAALEWMDSLGVRLVNTSLGYSTGHDNPSEDYVPGQMNGHTAAITRAAATAVREKGMLLVVAAGNEGGSPGWQVVAAPADAEGVISVGATDRLKLKQKNSSTGPPFLPYVKPDVTCFSTGGTSLAAPVITALVACILQHNPALTNQQISRLLTESGHLYPYGNNYLGGGVPDAGRMLRLMDNPGADLRTTRTITRSGKKAVVAMQAGAGGYATVFHKTNAWVVVKQDTVPVNKRKVTLQRDENVERSTVVTGKQVLELVWK
jgi:subtilisin family serine protease